MIVSQDLIIRAGSDGLARLRETLLKCVVPPWRHDPDREGEIRRHARDNDVIAFGRGAGDRTEAAGLVLWSRNDAYKVVNTEPSAVSELEIRNYNAVLLDFVTRVVEPASRMFSCEIILTAPERFLQEWLPAASILALRKFSANSNKGIGLYNIFEDRSWSDFDHHS